jgi:SAM-dependent methyltransferase
MFFPDRVRGIKDGDNVLEIGPGTSPFARSNVLLEKRFDNAAEHARQCGGTPASMSDSRTVFYEGDVFPFKDKEFDYVICSHVLEHVDDVEAFVTEMFRVAKAGYLEYPLIYYDYVFDIPEHVNLLMKREDALVYCKKDEVFSLALKPVQKLWYSALASGYVETASDLVPFTMQGYEWFGSFNVRKTENISELFLNAYEIPPKRQQAKSFARIVIDKLKRLGR